MNEIKETDGNDLVVGKGQAIQEAQEASGEMAAIVRLAIEKDMGIEGLEKIVTLYREEQDRAAARQFFDDLSAFQESCPAVPKTSVAKIVSRKSGGQFTYNYAELEEIVRTVRPVLHKHGFSYGWDTTIQDGMLSCVCTLRHRNGHKETATFTCPVGSDAGMSEQQKYAAANTFAKRQSMIEVLGLVTAEPDLEGDPDEPIGEDDIAQLQRMFKGVNMSKERLFRLLGVTDWSEIKRAHYAIAVNAINSKKAQQSS